MNLPKIGISLGNICESAIYGTLNNLKPTKINGYNTCPFDLCVSNLKGIIDCLNTNFIDFCNPIYLKYDPGSNILRNEKYNFGFNHESPYHANIYIKENWKEGANHFINNNYINFIQRYEKRIYNLHTYCNGSHYVIFILQFQYDINTPELMNELNSAIKKRYPNLKYEIKIIKKDFYQKN